MLETPSNSTRAASENGVPSERLTERLLETVRVLANDIGPRPATSPAERRAAETVRRRLEDAGITDAREQFFAGPTTYGALVIPYAVAGTLAAFLTGRLGRLIGGLSLLGVVKGIIDLETGNPPPFTPFVSQGISQNVIATLPPAADVRQRLVLVAPLDSNRQRFTLPLPVPEITKPANTALLGGMLLGGLSMILGAVAGRRKTGRWQKLTALAALGSLVAVLYDETQPFVDGANGGASAIAVLLGLAETLRAQPLQHTEVVLLFAGSAAPGNIGLDHYLRQNLPPVATTRWIALQHVGSGRLGYVSLHGISHLGEYRPGPRLTAIAQRVAKANPALRVNGRDLTTVDAVGLLRKQGYEAIAIAGYDDQGKLPDWNRVTDSLDAVEGDTLARALRYTLALARELDAST